MSSFLRVCLLLVALLAACAVASATSPFRLTESHAVRAGSRIRSSHTVASNEHRKPLLTKTRSGIPAGWGVHSSVRLSPLTRMHMRFSLAHSNTEQLEQRFWQISDPAHEQYTNFMSPQELQQLVRPAKSDVKKVVTWLKQYGIVIGGNGAQSPHPSNSTRFVARLNSFHDEIDVLLPLRLVEQMLHTRFHLYVHEATGTRIVRCAAYSFPADLSAIIAHVGPTLHMVDVATIRGADGTVATAAELLRNYDDTRMRADLAGQQMRDASAAAHSPGAVPSCTPYVDLPCLEYLYSINGAYGSVPSNGIGATGYHQEYIASEDIHDFLLWFDPQWINDDVTVLGPNDQSNPGGEATMDVQLIMGIASGIPAYFLSTGGSEPHGPSADEPFLAFLSALLDMQSPPLAMSTSYGDNELDLDVSYLNQVNTKFQMAGVMGISLLFASGDGGVAGGYAVPNCTDFIAVFPSASPFVTAVGGTQLDPSTLVESGINFSSGGFSNYWPQPSYQSAAVKFYLQQSGAVLPPASLYNSGGRAFPDLAAIANNLPTVIRGQAWPAGGTSCASPIVTGVVALLNDMRMQAGKKSLGFLNPMLYSLSAQLGPSNFTNDVTLGNNPGCGTNGFYAAPAWVRRSERITHAPRLHPRSGAWNGGCC